MVPTFPGCFDRQPWHSPVGGSVEVANPLLFQLWSTMPKPVRWTSSASANLLRALTAITADWNIFHTGWTENPLHPTSTGNSHARQLLPLHAVMNSAHAWLFRWYAFPRDNSTVGLWWPNYYVRSYCCRAYIRKHQLPALMSNPMP